MGFALRGLGSQLARVTALGSNVAAGNLESLHCVYSHMKGDGGLMAGLCLCPDVAGRRRNAVWNLAGVG